MLCTDTRYRAIAFVREHTGTRFDVPPPRSKTNSDQVVVSNKFHQWGEVSDGVIQQSGRDGEPDT